MTQDFADRIALVTGASRGLGAAVAEALAARGAHVIALARTVGALEELDDRIKAAGGSATLAPIDLTKDDAVAGICRAIYDRWGRIDLLVHCAVHAAPLTPAAHIDAKDLAKSVDTNVTATARIIRMASPLLEASPSGTAVMIDDDCDAKPFFGSYGATKAAARALAGIWQAETARTGPRVMLHTPAPMPTATRARFFPGEDRAPLAAPADEARKLLARLQD